MRRILLAVGGVMQLLFAVVHVAMFRGIARSNVPAIFKDTAHLLNAAVLVTVLFFAYVSFFETRTLTGRRFGRILLLFISLFYVQRGLVEVYLRGLQPVALALFLAVALVYGLAAIPEKPRPARPTAAEPEIPAAVP